MCMYSVSRLEEKELEYKRKVYTLAREHEKVCPQQFRSHQTDPSPFSHPVGLRVGEDSSLSHTNRRLGKPNDLLMYETVHCVELELLGDVYGHLSFQKPSKYDEELEDNQEVSSFLSFSYGLHTYWC